MDLLTPGVGLIFWQLIGFLLLLFVLGKYAWKPILGTLQERENSITEALEAAEVAKNEMKALQAENEKLLDDARAERDLMLKEALKTASTIKDEARAESSKIGQKMIDDARAVINTEKQAALTEVKNQVAQLSLQVAEKLLRKELTDKKAQKELVSDYIKDIQIN